MFAWQPASEIPPVIQEPNHQQRSQPKTPPASLSGILHLKKGEPQTVEASEPSSNAFGFPRNANESVAAVEFRLRSGNSIWLSYHWLGTWQYNPSEGLLLRFCGDLTYLVLIRGSNLDRPLKDGGLTLASGLQQHRVLWVREMTEEEVQEIGDSGPTIGSIEVTEFESHKELKEWLRQNVPAFLH
jgi:hypothetical protein